MFVANEKWGGTTKQRLWLKTFLNCSLLPSIIQWRTRLTFQNSFHSQSDHVSQMNCEAYVRLIFLATHFLVVCSTAVRTRCNFFRQAAVDIYMIRKKIYDDEWRPSNTRAASQVCAIHQLSVNGLSAGRSSGLKRKIFTLRYVPCNPRAIRQIDA